MPIDFFYNPLSPPSCMVWMVLRELGIEYKGNIVDLGAKEHKTEAYKKINPHMQVPSIKDGEFLLSESRAIATYLCQKHEKADKKEKLYPRDSSIAEVAKFNLLIFRDVDNYFRLKNYLNREAINAGRATGPNDALLPRSKAILAEYDAILANQDYIFGKHLTFLDFAYANTVRVMAMSGFDVWGQYKYLDQWQRRLSKRLPYFEEYLNIEGSRKYWKNILASAPALVQQKNE